MRSRTKALGGGGLEASVPAGAARMARIVAIDDKGRIFVSVNGNPKACAAVLAAPIDQAALRAAMDQNQEAVVIFENGDPTRPIILGLVMPGPLPDGVGGHKAGAGQAPTIEADVDGRRVRVRAEDELVFQCGKASITLRRNGRVIVRGTEIVTHADGTNRVWGSQVKIN